MKEIQLSTQNWFQDYKYEDRFLNKEEHYRLRFWAKPSTAMGELFNGGKEWCNQRMSVSKGIMSMEDNTDLHNKFHVPLCFLHKRESSSKFSVRSQL